MQTGKNSSRPDRKSKGRAASVQSLIEIPSKRTAVMTDQQRYDAIALAAYYLSEARGFEPGHELEDWINAETQLDSQRSTD
jgi:hypothetical protein